MTPSAPGRHWTGTALICTALICAALPGQPATAADDGGKFAIKGAGLQTCGGFLAALGKDSPDVALYGGWIDGYLTGLNQFTPQTYDLAPWQVTPTLLGMTKSVCDQSPAEMRFMDAFFEVVRLLQTQSLRTESPAMALTHDGRSVIMYTEVVARIRARLVSLGLLKETQGASFDAATVDALKAFQTDRGLTVTGLPDQPTLFELLMRRP